MFGAMRTTINLDDGLLDRVKRLAAATHRTVSEVISDALRRSFDEERTPSIPPQIPTIGGTGPVLPGIPLTDNAALADLLDDDVPVDQRR